MNNEQVGLYIRMLCAQHQHGGRIDTNVLRTQCESITGGMAVYAKFIHDKDGSYNERLKIEMDKRKAKSAKASESVKSRWNKVKSNDRYERNTNVIRTEIVNENQNEIKIEKDKGGMGEKEKTNLPARMNAELTIQMSVTENNRAHDVIDMQNNLPRGSGKKMAEIFLSMLDATGELQKHNPDDMGKYFINWANYHAKRLRPMLENAGNKSEVVSTYFEKTTGKQTTDEMLKSLHAYLK